MFEVELRFPSNAAEARWRAVSNIEMGALKQRLSLMMCQILTYKYSLFVKVAQIFLSKELCNRNAKSGQPSFGGPMHLWFPEETTRSLQFQNGHKKGSFRGTPLRLSRELE